MVTGVREHDGRVWLGSLHEPAVAVVEPLRRTVALAPTHGHPRVDHVAPRPARPQRRPARRASRREIRDFLVADLLAHRRPPRPQPRRRRADPGDPPGLRLPARPGRLRHRPPGLRAQAGDRPAAGLRARCARRAASAATRARPSPTTTSSRTPTPRPRSATPTASPRPTRSAARTATSSPSSATARSPAAWPGRRSTTSRSPSSSRLVIVVNDNGRSYTPDHRRPGDRAHLAAHQPALRARRSTWSSAASTPCRASAPRRTTPCTR